MDALFAWISPVLPPVGPSLVIFKFSFNLLHVQKMSPVLPLVGPSLVMF